MSNSNSIQKKSIKIYLEDYSLEKITKQLMNKLDPYYQSSKIKEYMFSTDGVFILQKGKLFKQIPQDKPIQKINYVAGEKNIVLLIDECEITEIDILSQFPYEHITNRITEMHYTITPPQNNKKGTPFFIHLVIECIYETDLNNKEKVNFIPTDFYFLANEKIDNYLIQKDFNVFLSMLI